MPQVGLAVAVARGVVPPECIHAALNPSVRAPMAVPLAPAFPLLLVSGSQARSGKALLKWFLLVSFSTLQKVLSIGVIRH